MSRLDVLYDNESILAKGVTAVERPRIPTPKLRTNSIEIPGRHGSLAEVDAYDDILIPIKYYILNAEIKPLIRTIKGFLQNKRFLQFSDDDIFYKIKKINILEIENEFAEDGVFVVDHVCDPFQYQLGVNFVEMTNPGTIVNPGTIESAPLYKIYGSGGSSGELVINDTTIEVINLSGTITLDAELKNAYEGDILTYASNRNDNIRGIIPPLNVGSNTVSYSGGITKLEINGRWRYV